VCDSPKYVDILYTLPKQKEGEGWSFRAVHSPHARFNLRRKSPNPIYSLPFTHLTLVPIHSSHKFIPHPNQNENQTLNSEKRSYSVYAGGESYSEIS
jgi:hypothetical protein